MRRKREAMGKGQAAVAWEKISRRSGRFALLDPIVEEKVCARLGLKAAPSYSDHSRDNYAVPDPLRYRFLAR